MHFSITARALKFINTLTHTKGTEEFLGRALQDIGGSLLFLAGWVGGGGGN